MLTNAQKRVCVKVANHVHRECQVIVSVDTMRRALHVVGLRSKVKQKKPKLNQKHIKEWLKFARRHEYWTFVIGSALSSQVRHMQIDFSSDGCSWCWICDGQSCDSRQFQQTIKFDRGSVLVWGCTTF